MPGISLGIYRANIMTQLYILFELNFVLLSRQEIIKSSPLAFRAFSKPCVVIYKHFTACGAEKKIPLVKYN